MPLPACLTNPDVDASRFAKRVGASKRFYEVIASRPRRVIEVSPGVVGVWSPIQAFRCVLTRAALNERSMQGFLLCILREFDELPQ